MSGLVENPEDMFSRDAAYSPNFPYYVYYESCQYWSRVARKPAFCICENKDADQLHGNREADRHLCFRYIDSTIPLHIYEISSLLSPSVPEQPGLCWTWLETPKTGFLTTRLIVKEKSCCWVFQPGIAKTKALICVL